MAALFKKIEWFVKKHYKIPNMSLKYIFGNLLHLTKRGPRG